MKRICVCIYIINIFSCVFNHDIMFIKNNEKSHIQLQKYNLNLLTDSEYFLVWNLLAKKIRSLYCRF